MKVLAFDPDTKTSAWALIDEDENTVSVGMFKTRGGVLSQIEEAIRNFPFAAKPDRVWVEGQHYFDRAKSAKDLFPVAQVAGALLALSMFHFPHAEVDIAEPGEWTKGIDKPTRLRRVQGLWYPELTDEAVMHICKCRKSEVNHVLDAVAMARWGLQ